MTGSDFGLNEKQRRFCEAYVRCGEAKAAYMDAYQLSGGTRGRYAETSSSRLMRNDKCHAYINFLQEESTKKTIMSRAQVLQELSDLGEVTKEELKSWNAPKEMMAKLSDKIKALEILVRHYKDLNEQEGGRGNNSRGRESRSKGIRDTIRKLRR